MEGRQPRTKTPITALRTCIKLMLSDWLGLKIERGVQTRTLNPCTETKMYNINVIGWDVLLDLVALYSRDRYQLTAKDARRAKITIETFDTTEQRAFYAELGKWLEWYRGLSDRDQDRALDLYNKQQARGELNLRRIITVIEAKGAKPVRSLLMAR